jgi:hypothetical protein
LIINSNLHTCICICINIYRYIYLYKHTNAHIYLYRYIHIYAYLHISCTGSKADMKFKEMNELLWIPYKNLKTSKVNAFFTVVLKIKSLQKWFKSKENPTGNILEKNRGLISSCGNDKPRSTHKNDEMLKNIVSQEVHGVSPPLSLSLPCHWEELSLSLCPITHDHINYVIFIGLFIFLQI